MTDAHRFACAISATAFSIAFIVLIMVFGGHEARVAVMLAAFLGIFSQFAAQDIDARVIHLIVSYLGFVAALLGLVLFALGR